MGDQVQIVEVHVMRLTREPTIQLARLAEQMLRYVSLQIFGREIAARQNLGGNPMPWMRKE